MSIGWAVLSLFWAYLVGYNSVVKPRRLRVLLVTFGATPVILFVGYLLTIIDNLPSWAQALILLSFIASALAGFSVALVRRIRDKQMKYLDPAEIFLDFATWP